MGESCAAPALTFPNGLAPGCATPAFRRIEAVPMNAVNETPEYYRMRETQERDLAHSAATRAISKIHLELADKYRELARQAAKHAANALL